jgi:uncharacterized RDD family membrane protein YckC
MILHEVLTTEKVPITYRVAGLGARSLAWLVDLLLSALLGLIGACFGMVLDVARPGLGAGVTILWVFAVFLGYSVLFEWLWQGQTPGKRLLGVRVIEWRGTAVSFVASAVRNVVRMADVLPLGYGLAFVVAACNRENRRLGDLAAGTLVVYVERQAKPILALHAGGDADRARLSLWRQRLGTLGREQKQALLDLCLRRDQLRVGERARLFRTTAAFFQERLDLAPDEYESDEKFVLQLAAALGDRAG